MGKRLRIMVSSSVYGYEEMLEGIYNLLVTLGYDVMMSHKGTIRIDPDRDSVENCLSAVRDCDLFLGVITTHYGSTMRDGLSATHLEFLEAIRLNKPRWFLVADRVAFAKQLLGKLTYEGKPLDLAKTGISKNPIFTDLRLLDMYRDAEERHQEDGQTKVRWIQKYLDDDSARLFVTAQFDRPKELEALLKRRLGDVDAVAGRIDEINARKGIPNE